MSKVEILFLLLLFLITKTSIKKLYGKAFILRTLYCVYYPVYRREKKTGVSTLCLNWKNRILIPEHVVTLSRTLSLHLRSTTDLSLHTY